jgi:hypothetical protein
MSKSRDGRKSASFAYGECMLIHQTRKMTKQKILIVVLPGDGIGPEVVKEARRVLDTVVAERGQAADFPYQIEFQEHAFGGAGIDQEGTVACACELIRSKDIHCHEVLSRLAKNRLESCLEVLEDPSGTIHPFAQNKDCWNCEKSWTCTPTFVLVTFPARV